MRATREAATAVKEGHARLRVPQSFAHLRRRSPFAEGISGVVNEMQTAGALSETGNTEEGRWACNGSNTGQARHLGQT